MSDQPQGSRSGGTNLGAAAKHELAIECLYTALLQLMEVKPYPSITVTDICRRAGVSRMAYYRNYTDKGDILIKRFESLMDNCVDRLECGGRADEQVILSSFFASLQSDGLVEAIVRAGLMDRFMRIHLSYARRAYQNVLHLDLSDAESEMRLYQRMGAVAGIMIYLVDSGSAKDPGWLATMLLSGQRMMDAGTGD